VRGYDERLKERGVLMPQEVATLRRDIRERLKDIIEQIDDLVIELLKTGSTIKATSKGTLDYYSKRKT
jgi:diphthamide biosynthesis methyltransferase